MQFRVLLLACLGYLRLNLGQAWHRQLLLLYLSGSQLADLGIGVLEPLIAGLRTVQGSHEPIAFSHCTNICRESASHSQIGLRGCVESAKHLSVDWTHLALLLLHQLLHFQLLLSLNLGLLLSDFLEFDIITLLDGQDLVLKHLLRYLLRLLLFKAAHGDHH